MEFITIINNKIISNRVGMSILEGEVENTLNLKVGMELINGEWIFPIVTPQPTPITLEELKENQLILMDVIATMYEDMMAKGTV